jgi:predicted transcriptional regulator
MNLKEQVRAAILVGLRAGRSVAEIAEFNKLKRTTVRDVKHRYEAFIAGGGVPEEFNIARKVHKRRSDALDGSIVAALQRIVDENPSKSLRAIAKELGISEATVRRKIAIGEIRDSSHAVRWDQNSSSAAKERRLEKDILMRSKLKNSASKEKPRKTPFVTCS